MRVVVQRCKKAKCIVENKTVGKIEKGLLLLVSFTEGDTKDTILWMVNKIINLRIFDDEDGVMNYSIKDVGGSILSISQFTLYADTQKGNRPSYSKAMKGDKAKFLYQYFNKILGEKIEVETGIFGASMEIEFTNMGPVTILLER